MRSLRYYFFSRFLGVIFLQIVIGLAISWSYISNEMRQSQIDNGFNNLKSVSKNISHFYYQQTKELSGLTSRPDFTIENKSWSKNLVKEYLEIRQIISSVEFYSHEGDFAFKVKSQQAPKYENDQHLEKHIEAVIEAKKTLFTHPLYTSEGEIYYLAIVPIFKKDSIELKGILSITFFPNINQLNESLTGLTLSNKNFLVLADRRGNIISTNGIDKIDVKNTVKHFIGNRGGTDSRPFKYIRKSHQELTYKIGDNKYFFISVKAPKIPFIVILALNEQIIDRELGLFLKMLIIIPAISTFIGLFLSIFFSKKITKEINVLVQAVMSLKSGNFKPVKRTKLHNDFSEALDEIEDLSIEIEKGRLLGNLWGQETSLKDNPNDQL